MFQEFEGYLFDETVETGRVKIKITAEQSGLSIKGENIQHKIQWNNLILEYGGSYNSQIFIKSKLDPKVNLFTSDTTIIKEIKNKAGMYSETILRPLTKDNTKRFFLSFGFITSVFFAIILGAALLFYFNYSKLKKMAAKAVPVEIENKLGETIFKSSVDQTKIIEVPEVTKVLNDIYAKFKPHLHDQPYQFHFYLIRNEELNAFALPGGYVVVHTGLILEAESAEELAGVLAHEISHVTERHSVQRIISSLGIVVVCQVFLGDVSGLATIIVQGAQFVSMMQFSQSQETEADQMGFELMKKAKISHLGFIDFFKRTKAKKNVIPDQIKDTLSFFSTHPPDESRIKSIDDLFKKNSYEPEKLDINWAELKTALKAYLNK